MAVRYIVLFVLTSFLCACDMPEQSNRPGSGNAPEVKGSSRRPRQIDYNNPEHEDVIALVKRARSYYTRNGDIKALDDFMDPSSQFVAGNTYVFVYDYAGKCLAEWGNPSVVGKDMSGWSDMNNNPMFAQASDKARNGGGWYSTTWRAPNSTNIRPKDCYVIDVDGKVFVGSGVYR